MKILILALFVLFFSINQVHAKAVTYEVDGKKYEGFVVNKGSKAPLVILIHDWDGLTDYEVKRSQMLGKLGYSVFSVDLFGQGVRPVEESERRKLTGELYSDRDKMRKLLTAGLNEAGKLKLNTKNAVVIGYCFGGAAALEMARAGGALKSFVSFHGGLATPEGQNYQNTNGHILVLHGTSDEAVSMDEFSALAKELDKTKVSHELISYGGAPHAFTVFDSKNYRKDADQKSWARFTEHLKAVTK